ARCGERIAVGNRDDLVEVVETQHRRSEAWTAACDAVGPGLTTGKHSGFRRFHSSAVDVRQGGAQLPAHTEKASGGAHERAEGVDLAVEFIDELAAQGAVAVDHV